MMALSTRNALLKEAENLVRTRGYSAFSYADLSAKVGIRKASIHHHFPKKEELAGALIEEYLVQFEAELAAVAAKRTDTKGKLRTYGNFFAEGLDEGLLPLCGALASEAAFLPQALQAKVTRFFRIHLRWLEAIIREGIAAGEVRDDLKPDRVALHILSTLQGASLVAWALKDGSVLKPALREALDTLDP